MNIIPLFTTHYSIGQSILTLENETEIKSNSPVSVFAIAKQHKLTEINLVENTMSGFIEAYQNSKKHDLNLRFGLKLCVCEDITKKDDASFLTESNVIIWILNSNGYKDLLKIHNKAATDGFYYIPRTDWNELKEKITENLAISLPFYSSYVARNTLNFKHRAIPDFGNIIPIHHIQEHDLPFDDLLRNKIEESKLQTQKTHSVYYYKNEDIVPFTVFRCINNRSDYDSPGLSHFSSNRFSFESLNK